MDKRHRTLRSLAGLSVGDAFGQMFFSNPLDWIPVRRAPPGPWRWTDDTHMALSIVDTLFEYGGINRGALARRFAERFLQQPWRGYAGGAQRLLTLYSKGANWRQEAPKLFEGGSYGNGGAMRAAPIGAFFAADPKRAAKDGRRSASVTHAHPEGQAGAMAVAAAAAIICSRPELSGAKFIEEIMGLIPASKTRKAIEKAAAIGAEEQERAIAELGTGQQVAAFDTVPYCLWVVAHHSQDFETALWTTVSGLGDRDTTCAIVGGITALRRPIPPDWLSRRELLPAGYSV